MRNVSRGRLRLTLTRGVKTRLKTSTVQGTG